MKIAKGKRQREKGREQRTAKDLENRGTVRRIKAAMNWTGKRNFGESSTLSPKKLNKARKVPGSQKCAGILRTNEDKTKTTRMPIPPPFGVGIACELRFLGISTSPHFGANLPMTQAPIPPKSIQQIYRIEFSMLCNLRP